MNKSILLKKGKLIILLTFVFLGIWFANLAYAALSCQITSVSCAETTVFKMSATINAHAEMPGQTNYNYYVCCSGVGGLGNSCSGNYDTVLKLSDVTNAHVEKKTEVNYPNSVCLSVSGGTVSCDYSTDCSTLGAGYVCLASISGDTNAHVGDCNAYSTKVCCQVISGPDAPINIRCEGATNPTSVTDQTPDLGAEYDHPNPASVALYYQVQVIKEGGSWSSPLWDSTKTSCNVPEGSRKEIVYEGSPLPLDGAKYYQRWKFWDDEGNEGPWSGGTDYWMMLAPPTASTQDASLIGETGATLNGILDDDGGEASEYRFEYDTDSGEPYAQNTGWSGAGDTKTTGQSFSKNVTNLNRGTLYYFRAQAKNTAGIGSGSEKTFLTKPQNPLNFTATPGDTEITLSWTKGDGTQRTMIRRATDTYPATRSDGTQVYFDTGESYTDTGLTNEVTYYYSAWSEVTADSLQQYSDKATSSATPNIPTCAEHNIYGWAWSENIGWISFSCTDTMTMGVDRPDYGVDIYPATGIFSGYAWSENIGWITFNESELSGCPSGTCRAEIDLNTAEVSGWSRALAYEGGWDGWIKLSDTNYGVRLKGSTKEFEGWAWGDTVVGWLSFNRLNCDSDGDGISDQGNYTQCPVGETVADYKVETTLDFSFPPTANPLEAKPKNHCSTPVQDFRWEFDDPDGDSQGAYRLQVDKEGNWIIEPGEFDSKKVYASVENKLVLVTPDSVVNKLDYNTHYYWRLMVWDDRGTTSTDWSYGPEFDTETHIYPEPDFSWSPPSPSEEELVQFCATQESGVCLQDKSTCYDISGSIPPPSCSGKIFLWTFPEGAEFATGTSATSENPRVKFNTTGPQSVSLSITDDVGVCTSTKSVGVSFPLPEWKEIAP